MEFVGEAISQDEIYSTKQKFQHPVDTYTDYFNFSTSILQSRNHFAIYVNRRNEIYSPSSNRNNRTKWIDILKFFFHQHTQYKNRNIIFVKFLVVASAFNPIHTIYADGSQVVTGRSKNFLPPSWGGEPPPPASHHSPRQLLLTHAFHCRLHFSLKFLILCTHIYTHIISSSFRRVYKIHIFQLPFHPHRLTLRKGYPTSWLN